MYMLFPSERRAASPEFFVRDAAALRGEATLPSSICRFDYNFTNYNFEQNLAIVSNNPINEQT